MDKKNDFVEKDIAQSIRNELSDMDIVVSNCLLNGNEKYIFYCKTIEEETLKETIYQYSLPVYVGVFQSGNVLIQKANGEVEWYDSNTGEQKGFYSGMPHKLFMGRDNFYAVDNMNSQIVKVSEDSGKEVEIFSLKDEALLRSDRVGTELQIEVFENGDDDIFIMTPSGIFEVDDATKRKVKLISASESKAFNNVGNNTMGLLEKDGNIVLMSQEAVEEGIQLYAYEYVLGKQ